MDSITCSEGLWGTYNAEKNVEAVLNLANGLLIFAYHNLSGISMRLWYKT